MSKIVTRSFDSFPEAVAAMADELSRRVFSPDERYIVLCPDRYTQTLEQTLCGGASGRSGAIDLDVLTLSRLAKRVAPHCKMLSQEGGVMITSRAVAAVERELKYYSRATKFYDFAREAYKTLQQISSSDVSISEINSRGTTKLKLDDLQSIKAEYDKIKGEYKDATDRLEALADGASTSALLRSAHIYAIGYIDVTKLNYRVFGVLANCAKSFVLYDAKPTERKRVELELYSAPDRVSEYKHIAAEIRDYIHNADDNNKRAYSDISIVCESPRVMKRILGEYEIPTYTDETMPLYRAAPLSAIEHIYRLAHTKKNRGTIDCREVAALCKNPYAGVDGLCAEKFGYEATTYALTFAPADYEPKDADARRAYARILEILDVFMRNRRFADAVTAVIEFCDFEKTMQKLDENGKATDAVTPVISLIELSERYGSGEFDADAKSFFSAAQAVNINTLPRERNCVTVTTAGALRLSVVKKLFVADFAEGVQPQTVGDHGLISDADIAATGGIVEPSIAALNRREREELKAVVINSDSVLLSYATSDGGKCSSFIDELVERKNIKERCYDDDMAALRHSTNLDYIAKHAGSANAAREIVARKLSAHANAIASATEGSKARSAPFCECIGTVEKTSISVSELSDWFKCPYYRFLHDSAKVGERRAGFGAADFGTVLHDFMERFVKDKTLDRSRENVKRILDAVLAERDIKPDDAEYARIVENAVDYAVVNADVIESGKYDVAETEYRFRVPKMLGTRVSLDFEGYIDRFDICDNRVRILDYKTGRHSFSKKKCEDGTDMQLPLYAAVLEQNGAKDERYNVTGMFYVPRGGRYAGDGENDCALSGCMLKDVALALEYDVTLVPGGERSRIIPARLNTDKKNGTVVFDGRYGRNTLYDGDKMDALMQSCLDNANIAVDEIVEGHIVRSPIDGACEYCPYLGICGGGAPRQAPMSDDDRIGGEPEKERE